MKKKKIFTRIAAVATAAAITVTAAFDVPWKIISALLAEETHENHKVCENAENCPDCEHIVISDWVGINDLSTLETGKHYYLIGDVQLTERVTIARDVNITLCLNGHTITAASGK